MNRNNDNNGKCREFPVIFPPQHQNRHPGFEYVMNQRPMAECNCNCRKLENKVALITGGDSGIGREVAYDCTAVVTRTTSSPKTRCFDILKTDISGDVLFYYTLSFFFYLDNRIIMC